MISQKAEDLPAAPNDGMQTLAFQAQIGNFAFGMPKSAFGWQVRAFGGKDNIGGANVGVFLRRVDGETLYGINTFADYESGKYGDFLRYGIGGELQSPYAAFAANYYLPITDDKHNGAKMHISQKGYDTNLAAKLTFRKKVVAIFINMRGYSM